MGADIHGVLQYKVGNDYKWHTECEIEDGRNYALFSALAGVRNYRDITPIADLRGLPEGLELNERGDSVKHYWSRDGAIWLGDHSHTWYTLDEVLDWPGWDRVMDEEEGDTLRDWCATFLAWCQYAKLKTGCWGDARIVIGFDS